MSLTVLLEQMLMLVLIMAAGLAAGKAGIIDADGNRKISKVILDVAQPAMILASASGSRLELDAGDMLSLLLCGCAMYAVLFLLAYAMTPLFGKERDRLGVCRFMTVFGNVGFMGFPVVSALYGPEAVVIAAIYLIPFNLLAYSVGILMLTGRKDSRMNLRAVLNPALVTSVLALPMLIFRIHFPYVLHEACDTLGAMTVPGAMLVIGVTLGSTPVRAIFSDKHIYSVCLARLLLSPLLVWLLCRFVLLPLTDLEDSLIWMLVILAAMPVAAISTMLSIEHGCDSRLASNGVFLTTALSIVTAPLMMWLLMG